MKRIIFLVLVFWSLVEATHDLPPLKCIVQNPTQPPFKPDFPLPICRSLDELTCCSYRDAIQVQRAFNNTYQPNINISQQCRNDLETLWCGASCAPSQPFYVNLYEYTFVICSSFCRRLYQSCQTPALASQFSSSSDPALAFCQQQLIYNFSVIVNDGVECYNGLQVDTSSEHSVATGRGLVPGVAGFNYNFTVYAHDEFTNSRVQGNEFFEAFFNPSIPSTVIDNNNGSYLVTFTPQANIYNISVVVNGESIYKSPFITYFENQTSCYNLNGAPPKNPAQTPNGTCPFYSETSCCTNQDADQINSGITNVNQIYGDSSQCVYELSNIGCALSCDPRQSEYIKPINPGDNVTTTAPGEQYEVFICREYCAQLLNTCGSVRLPGGFTVRDYYQTGDNFCSSALSQLFPKYLFEVTTSVCFGGVGAYPTSPPDSYPYGRDLYSTTACQSSYFNIHTRDKFRNDRISGGDDWNVVFNGPSTGPSQTYVGRIYDFENGTYSVFYNISKTGIYSVSASLNLQDFLSQSPWKLTIYPGLMDPSQSYASGPGVSSAPVGVQTSFLIYSVDSCGNELISGGNIFNVTITFPNGTNITATPIDNGDGTYLVNWFPSVTGTYYVTITNSSGYPIKGSPYTVTIFGDLDLCKTKFIGVNQTQAGNLTIFQIITYDVSGNRYGLGGQSWEAAVSGSYVSELGRIFNANDTVRVTDNGDGTYNVSFIPFIAKPIQVYIALRNNSISCPSASSLVLRALYNVGINATVYVVPGPLDPKTTGTIGDATSIGYVNVDNIFFIHGRDSWDNSLTKGGDNFTIRFAGPGIVTFTIVDDKNGTYTVDYIPSAPGIYIMTIITKGSHIVGSPFTIHVGAAPAGVYSTADGPGLEAGVAGKTNIFLITAFDETGHRIYTGGDNYNVIISPEQTEQPITINPLPFTNGFRYISPLDKSIYARKTDNTDGTYTVQYITNVAGFYNITIGSLAPRSTGPIIGSPWRVEIYPDVIYPEYSPVTGPGTIGGIVGQVIPFFIQGKDKYNNTLISGGDVIEVTFFKLDGTNVTSNFTTEIIDNRNGTYTVDYATTLAGKFIMNVNLYSPNPLDCRRFMGSPFLITILPLGPDCPSSTAYGPGLSAAFFDIPANGPTYPNYFYIQARDYFGNPVAGAGLTFDIAFEQNGVFFPSNAYSFTRQDFGNGTYLINYWVIGNGLVYLHVYCPGGVEIYQSPFLINITGPPCNPPDCNGHGACIAGQCQCFPPYLPPDCSNTGPITSGNCRFSNLGVHILCDFPIETDRARKRRYFECNELFTVSNPDVFLAPGHFCYWRTYSRVAIALGNNPTINVNSTLIIKGGQIRARFGGSNSQPNSQIVANIDPPRRYPYPRPHIISWTRGPADRLLVLDATGSTGTGGRNYTSGYIWTLISGPTGADLTSINNLLRSTTANNTGIVRIPPRTLIPGTYRFRLDAMNFFNRSGFTETNVTILSQSVPDVYVNGPKNITARVYDDLFFTGSASNSSAGNFSFSWSRIDGPLLPNTFGQASSGKLTNFYIPAYTLTPNQTYVFEFSATSAGNYSSFDRVTVHVLDPLKPVINPADRSVFRLSPLIFNATQTIAYNTDPNSYVFDWSCYNTETPGTSCIDEAGRMLYLQSSPTIRLPPASFHPGIYVFNVSVTRGDQTAAAATFINITMEDSTVVSFSRSGVSSDLPKHNYQNQLAVDVSIFGVGNGTTNYTWEVSPPDFDLVPPVTVGPTNEKFLVIDQFWPVGHVLYNFTIYNATFGDPIGTIGVRINEPPLGGVCTLNPKSGNPSTLFTVTCTQWEDDDLPLFYYVLYVDPNGVENPLIENPSSSNVLQFFVPPSVPAGSSSLVKILVLDANGGFSNVTFFIPVSVQQTKRQPTLENYLNLVRTSSVAGDIEAETQNLFLLFTYLNFLTDETTIPIETRISTRSEAMTLIATDYTKVPNTEQGIELKMKLILALTQLPNEVDDNIVILIDDFVTSVLTATVTEGMSNTLAGYTLEVLGRLIAANQFISPEVAAVRASSTVQNINRLALSVVALNLAGLPPFTSNAQICFNITAATFLNSSISLINGTVLDTQDPDFSRNLNATSGNSTSKVTYCTSIYLQASKDPASQITNIFTHNPSRTNIVIPPTAVNTLQLQAPNDVVSSFWVSTTDPYAWAINTNRINAYINSPVTGLTYFSNNQQLALYNSTDPIAITLLNIYTPLTYPEYLRCRYWSPQGWSDGGCVVGEASSDLTVCYCNHLTEFSVLLRPFLEVPSGLSAYRSNISPLDMEGENDHIDQWWLFALILGLGLLTLMFAFWHRTRRAAYVNIEEYNKRATMVVTLEEDEDHQPIAVDDEDALGLGVPLMRKRAKFAIAEIGNEFGSDIDDTPLTRTEVSLSETEVERSGGESGARESGSGEEEGSGSGEEGSEETGESGSGEEEESGSEQRSGSKGSGSKGSSKGSNRSRESDHPRESEEDDESPEKSESEEEDE